MGVLRNNLDGLNIYNKKLIVRLLFIAIGSIPVLLFMYQFSILDSNLGLTEDWGYFTQQYEAARISILTFHQFPWWNPWALGGVPLYANPQFGLISVQMPFVLIFGTLAGLRLAVTAYMLLGLWGMYLLLKRLSLSNNWSSLFLSYCWIFSGFTVLHLSVGHLTFATYLLAPWAVLALLNIHSKYGWLWLGILVGILINQSVHYITFQLIFILAIVAAYKIVMNPGCKRSPFKILRPYALAGATALTIGFHKLFFTLGYLQDYPRTTMLDTPNSMEMITQALTSRAPATTPHATIPTPYAWHEYGAYIGIITLVLAFTVCCIVIVRAKTSKPRDLALVVAMVVSLLLSIGAFSPISPYALLHNLPIFEQMRVPSRWLGWFIFGAMLILYKLPSKRYVVVLLAISSLDVFLVNRPVLAQGAQVHIAQPQFKQTFEQVAYFGGTSNASNPMRLFEATQSNRGEIYGYEPIVEFYPDYNPTHYAARTSRCGVNQGCPFVLSGNATVSYWSPNYIELRRITAGPITLNINPSNKIKVNGKQLNKNWKIFELKEYLKIDNPNQTIVLTIEG